MSRTAFYIIMSILCLAGLIYFVIDSEGFGPEPDEDRYEIVQKWNLPLILNEISGISWLEENKIACIQDEEGIIFIYNMNTSEIEKQIRFAGLGDYEGIAINGDTAYVLRSDGEIFEVKNFLGENPEVKSYKTPLTRHQDVEGLCLDKENNQLLLAIKDKEPDSPKYKGVYSFGLISKTLNKEPVFRINLEDSIFNELKMKKLLGVMMPSEINIHPETGKIYILDGTRPKLLISNKEGEPEEMIILNKNNFSQPEGLTFSPSGKMYISNEGAQYAGNILEVELISINND